MQRLEHLQSLGLIVPAFHAPSTGGRPAGRFAFSPDSLGVIGADVSPQGTMVGLYNLAGQCVSYTSLRPEIGIPTMEDLSATGVLLADASKRTSMKIVGVGLTGNDDVRAMVGRLDPGASMTVRHYSTLEAKAVSELANNNVDTAGLLYLDIGERVSCAFVTNDLVRRTTDLGIANLPPAVSRGCSCSSTSCQSAADASSQSEAEKDQHAVTFRRMVGNVRSSVTSLISLLVPDRLVIDSPWNGSAELLAELCEWVHAQVREPAGRKIRISYSASLQGNASDPAAMSLLYEILCRKTIDGM